METKMSISFLAKKCRETKDKLLPIYLRVTINGKRFEISTNRYLESEKWSSRVNKAKGNSEEARNLNTYLDLLRNKVYQYKKELFQEGSSITIESFKRKWLGLKENPLLLLDIFQKQNDQMKLLVGKEFAAGTAHRYWVSLEHTRKFIKWKYLADDIDIRKLDYGFISEYAFWLKSERNCNQNSTIKYLGNFKKIVNYCVMNGWLKQNPFFGFKMIRQDVIREFLTPEELQKIAEKQFVSPRLNLVRDIFLFSCYTGLAYVDVKKLKCSDIAIGVDGEQWIFTHRQKTDTPSRIPMLDLTLKIIEGYNDDPRCLNQDLALPVLSNQKMNAYLKEIADVCHIKVKEKAYENFST